MSTPARTRSQQTTPSLQSETSPLHVSSPPPACSTVDAAINIMRRLIQAQGAEVIHLGHNPPASKT